METHKKWQNITAGTLAQMTALKLPSLSVRVSEDTSLWVTFYVIFFLKWISVENLDCDCVIETVIVYT